MKEKFWFFLGLSFILIGTVGIVLPLLPTTPFVLLAAYCFKKSSPKAYERLLSFPHLGPALQNWENHKIIPLRGKVLATGALLTSISYPYFTGRLKGPLIQSIVFTTLILLLIFIWKQKSKK